MHLEKKMLPDGRTHYLIMFNASAAKESACILRTYLTVVDGYKTRINGNDVEYGSAFHLFVKLMKETGNYAPAAKAARDYYNNTPMEVKSKKKYLTEKHLLSTCFNYWEAMGQDDYKTLVQDGRPLVELKFGVPFHKWEDDKIVIEVILCGTIDDIGQKQGGCYYINDYKTTSVWSRSDYFFGYNLDAQLPFYKLAISKYALMYPDSIFATIAKQTYGVMITGIFHKPEGSEFERSQMFFFKPDYMVVFERLLLAKVKQLIEHVKLGHESGGLYKPDPEGKVNGACKTVYGPCKYGTSCAAVDSIAAQHVLNHHFTQSTYNPLTIHE